MKRIKLLIGILIIALFSSCDKIERKIVKEASEVTGKQLTKTIVKKKLRKRIVVYSHRIVKTMDDETLKMFKSNKYNERLAIVRGRKVPLLISPNFNKNLTVPKNFYGDFDVNKYHRGNPLYVVDGCETNLGRMKRGLAPVYYDSKKLNNSKGWGHYFPFELHHGGQKKNPAYFALMGDEHKTYSKQLHPKRIGSEINRNEFGQKERAPLYRDLADDVIGEFQ